MNGREEPTSPRPESTCLPAGPTTSAPRASTPAQRFRDFIVREDPRWINGTRVETCACGGLIVQYLGETIPEVVRAHNETRLHRAWSERG